MYEKIINVYFSFLIYFFFLVLLFEGHGPSYQFIDGNIVRAKIYFYTVVILECLFPVTG